MHALSQKTTLTVYFNCFVTDNGVYFISLYLRKTLKLCSVMEGKKYIDLQNWRIE